MAEPTGKIVARPMVARVCGHEQEFQFYAVDRFRAERLAKFKQTRCAECVAKLALEQQQSAQAIPKKGEAIRRLPAGAEIALTRQADGAWIGRLTADGTSVEVVGNPEAGPQSVVVALARQWVSQIDASNET